MATVVTISMNQLQGLLDAQTSQLESIVSAKMNALESNIEEIVDQKLQAKLQQAKGEFQQFVLEAIEQEDIDIPSETKQQIQEIKQHILATEQSVSRLVMGSSAAEAKEEIEVELDPLTLMPAVSFPPPPSSIRRNISAASSINTTNVMEKMVTDLCSRLEELVDDRTNHMLKKVEKQVAAGTANSGTSTPNSNSKNNNNNNPMTSLKPNVIRRSASSDSAKQNSVAHATAMAMRMNLHQMDELLTKRMVAMEQFIDSRHAELEAYVSSTSEQLHKSMAETLKKHARHNRALTKEELEQVLDARIQDVEEEEAALLALQQQQQRNNNNNQQQQQAPAESSEQQDSNTVVHQALEKLIQVQQEWIAVQTSTQDLEMQVQEKLEILQENRYEQQDLLNQPTLEIMRKIASKLESLEQLVLATSVMTPTTPVVSNKNSIKKKQRASTSGHRKSSSNHKSATNNKGLAQVISNHASKKGIDDTSTNVATNASTVVAANDQNNSLSRASSRVSNAYMDVSVDGRRMEEDEEGKDSNDNKKDDDDDEIISDSDDENNDKQNGGETGGTSRVKTFMNTLSNWKELNEKEKDARRGENDDDDDEDKENREKDDAILELDTDIDEGDDDIDSNASAGTGISVDSSVGDMGDNKDVAMAMERLEDKLDGLEDKVHRLLVATGNHHVIDHTAVGVPSERSTNAKHSRLRQYSSAEDVQQMVFAAHDALKRDLKHWLSEQQQQHDEDLLALSAQSQSAGTTDISDDEPASSPSGRQNRGNNGSNGSKHKAITAVLGTEQLNVLTEKLKSIEILVSTNQSFLQEQRRLAAPPVPKELPLQKDVAPTIELERKILNHLDTMDKSVQFKLDEIYGELQQPSRRRSSAGVVVSSADADLALLSPQDQSAIVEAIMERLKQIQDAITRQLKESIPDYGNAKSIIGESLEEMRQIVSEVAISEVELLKTQLGVAEEAEQEALHAVVVLRDQLEESKEQERRLLYANAPRPPQTPATQTPGNIFNFGAFAKLGLGSIAAAAVGPPAPPQQRLTAAPERYRHRKMSIGQQSNVSALSHPHHGSAGSLWSHPNNMNTYVTSGKRKSPQQKLEDWKSQVASLEDKATDLRTLYSQLREQDEDEWLSTSEQHRDNMSPTEGSAPVEAGFTPGSRFAGGESKEIEATNSAGISMQ